jgi:hypothetical protein
LSQPIRSTAAAGAEHRMTVIIRTVDCFIGTAIKLLELPAKTRP